MQVLNFSQARASLKQTMEDVCRDHEPAVVTRQRGEPVVVMSLEDYNSLMETFHLLREPTNAKRLLESIGQLEAGEATTRELITNGEKRKQTRQVEQ